MDPVTVGLGILQGIKLGTALLEAMNKGDMTPEEAAQKWSDASKTWGNAVDMWNAAKAPEN